MHHRISTSLASLLLALSLVGGCGDGADDPLANHYTGDTSEDPGPLPSDIGATQQALQGGLNQDGDPVSLGLVRLLTQRPDGFRAFCSGVAVTPTQIATAKHCFDEWGLGAAQVQVTLGNRSAWGSSVAKSATRDYAVLYLATSLAPPLANNFLRPVMGVNPQSIVGQTVACAGRGAVNADGSPNFGAPITGDFFTILQRDTTPNTTGFWIRNGAFGAHSMPGDSGGPCFLMGNGTTSQNAVLIGVIVGSGGAPDWWTFVQTFGS